MPFIMKFYTTIRCDLHRLNEFATCTESLFGEGALCGDFVVDDSSTQVNSFDDLGEFFEAGLPEWFGTLTITFGVEGGNSGRCDILRLRRKRKAELISGEEASYRMHEFSVEIISETVSKEKFALKMFDYFVKISDILNSEFSFGSFGRDIYSQEHTARGLAAGIPGIYELTAIGPVFSRLIGRNHLLELPVFRTVPLLCGGVAMQLNDHLSDDVGCVERRDAILKLIGREYFQNINNPSLGLPGGEIGFFSFMHALFKSDRQYRSKNRLAEKPPGFDWTGIFYGSGAG